jgi:hypothetical protein
MVLQFKKSSSAIGIRDQDKIKQSTDSKETMEECRIFLYFLAQNLTNFPDLKTILQTYPIPNERMRKELEDNSEHWTQILKNFKGTPTAKLPVQKFKIETVEPHTLKLPEYMK